MKKNWKTIFTFFLVGMIFWQSVWAEEEDFSNTDYWDTYCDITNENYDPSDFMQVNSCKLYYRHKLKGSNDRIAQLENKKKEIKNQLEEAQRYVQDYRQQAAALDSQIAVLSARIQELNVKIDQLTKEVESNKELVAALNDRVITRMRNAQKTMHFNPYLDFLLGANDLADLNRRSYGLQAVMSKDNDERKKLILIIEKLQKDEKELLDAKAEIDEKKTALQVQQAEFSALEEYYNVVVEETQKAAEANLNELENERRSYSFLAENLDISGIPSSAGLISPAPGASINAGTWHYPGSFGGGVHLGVDYGLSIGSNLYAPANGVVIVSSDGCGYGYLGDRCSGNGNGVAYGGNQVYIMMAANGSIYVASFSHLLAGSPVGLGPIEQGAYIGQVGSSGNSTGPHCHIELFYLGEGDMEDLLNDYMHRNYSQSFNCGWGYSALNRLCENGVGAPCRLRPENYFGS